MKATPYDNTEGYTVAHGDYTFTFRIDSFAQNDISVTSGGVNYWNEETLSHAQLFSSIGGDGLLGSYIRPAMGPASPESFLSVGGSGPGSLELGVRADSDIGDTIGVRTLNGTLLSKIVFGGSIARTFAIASAGSYLDPVAYFSDYIGNYSPLSNSPSFYIGSLTTQYLVEFEVSSFAISAVPEPSTYAAFAGVGAFGLVLWRRRRAAVAA